MANSAERVSLRVSGMHCAGCPNRIEKKLLRVNGVLSARASFANGNVEISFDPARTNIAALKITIESLGYTVVKSRPMGNPGKAAALLVLIAGLFFVLEHFGILKALVPAQLAEADFRLGMLFVIGLLTSVHCVAMCGGINLSQTLPSGNAQKKTLLMPAEQESALSVTKQHGTAKGMAKPDTQPAPGRFAALFPSLLYNAGRVVSYTVVGAAAGALGTAFTFSPSLQGAIKLVAGVWMVFMGLNALGLFPFLSKLTPKLPRPIAQRLDKLRDGKRGPFVIGLLNGLMPCGPLQSMQLYALSTGNPFMGALAMFLFALGTVPLMFGLGAAAGKLGKKFPAKAMAVGAVLVAVLGLSMFTQGWSLAGLPQIALPTQTARHTGTAEPSEIITENGVQLVQSSLQSGRYPNIAVKAGMPVRWVIDAPEGSINGCNYQFTVPEYGITQTLEPGENVLEFTPGSPGTYSYRCWMGMIRATITVT
ncbi:MAG: sulfite exporter TauE/SafE family protein [Oscillospiraceae bacterium]|nr:sulfite exporter TauE/SafE family protein [Oscillospiraceae bacterium]